MEASWLEGALAHDKLFEQATVKIQRMARAFLTRKIVNGGKFKQDGLAAWMDANRPPPLFAGMPSCQSQGMSPVCLALSLCLSPSQSLYVSGVSPSLSPLVILSVSACLPLSLRLSPSQSPLLCQRGTSEKVKRTVSWK